jgi:hypothetical protein
MKRAEKDHMNHGQRTHTTSGLSTLSIAALAALALAAPASAQAPRNSTAVTVYAAPNFGGQSMSFETDMPTLLSSGLNDQIASIKLPDGERWEICTEADYVGKCQVLSASAPDLGTIGWNGQISSLRRADRSAFAVTAYADANFEGERLLFADDTPNLANTRLSRKISSIEIPAGETWEVCEGPDYSITCQTLTASVRDLQGMQWGDRIASLRRIDANRFGTPAANPGEVQPSLLFFSERNFAGTSESFVSGKSDLGFPAREGSVQIRGGGVWQLCDRSKKCATIDKDVPDIAQLGLKGRITTVRTVDPARRTGGAE